MLGKPVKVGRGKIEIAFADEHELAEIVEALERIAGCRRSLESPPCGRLAQSVRAPL